MHILLWHLPGDFFPLAICIGHQQKMKKIPFQACIWFLHISGNLSPSPALLSALQATAPQGPAVPPGDAKPESSEDTWAACQSRVKLRDLLFRFFTAFISLSKILPYSPNDMGSLLLPQQSTGSTQLLVPVLSGVQPKIQWCQLKYCLPSISE